MSERGPWIGYNLPDDYSATGDRDYRPDGVKDDDYVEITNGSERYKRFASDGINWPAVIAYRVIKGGNTMTGKTFDLSTLSREELEELGQRVAVELEKKPEVVVVYGEKYDMGWGFGYSKEESDTHKLTIPSNLPCGTYTSLNGDVIKVEEV